jgi:ABC-type dipeptide/oligopeptide/nickel transport system permease subunit
MNTLRRAAVLVIVAVALCSGVGGFLPRFDYARQDRNQIDAAASSAHWLGTDALGRDRFARLMHGTRLSLLLAPAAAALSMLLALAVGAASGLAGGIVERTAKAAIDLVLSIPWLFLLLMVRAMLPLNTSPVLSGVVTFMVLGALGWAAPARILQAHASRLRQSQFMLLGRAEGIARLRLLWRQALPNLRPILLAQFWISVPIFILAEANLSLLGLGVAEPLPSLGSLLREMETVLSLGGGDLCRFAALLVLVTVVSSLQIAVAPKEAN